MSKKRISICHCGTPLIWTFCFAGAEWFCINCGAKGGTFGIGKVVEASSELVFKKRLVDALWKAIYQNKKGMLPPGRFGREGCKKDGTTCNDHRAHLTDVERGWDAIARKYLKQVNGLFDEKDAIGE